MSMFLKTEKIESLCINLFLMRVSVDKLLKQEYFYYYLDCSFVYENKKDFQFKHGSGIESVGF